MAKSKLVYTPIRARDGGLVHATTLWAPSYTACGKYWSGWIVSAKKELTCKSCEDALFTSTYHGVKQGRGKKRS